MRKIMSPFPSDSISGSVINVKSNIALHAHTKKSLNQTSFLAPKCLLTLSPSAKECPSSGGREDTRLYVCAKCKSSTAAQFPLHHPLSSILLPTWQLDRFTSQGNPPGSDSWTGNLRLYEMYSPLHMFYLLWYRHSQSVSSYVESVLD